MSFKKRICLILGFLAFIFCVSKVYSDEYVELLDNVYYYLDYLEAKGCIKSGILTTLPLTKSEVKRLIEEAKDYCGEDKETQTIINFILSKYPEFKRQSLVQNLKYLNYFKPIKMLEIEGGLISWEKNKTFERFYNQEGEKLKNGLNGKIKIRSSFKFNNFYGVAETEFKNTYVTRVDLQKGYLIWDLGNFLIMAGKESAWWGPGRSGSIILSNNPEPFIMVKIENEHPYILPYLGLFKFSFFATKLDKDQKVNYPYLWGMRINFKPCPWFEIGLSRTALLGGEGREASLKTWFKSFFAINENQDNPNESEPGDQRAGFDVKFTFPNKLQPIQLYFEAEGEDEAGHLPYKWAYIEGAFFPKLFTIDGLSLRVEYIKTNKYWYVHHIYGSKAYWYKGYIIGHPVGTNAKGFWGDIGYLFFPLNTQTHLGGEIITRENSGEKEHILYFSFETRLKYSVFLNGLFQSDFIKNFEGKGEDKKAGLFLLGVKIFF